MYQDKQLLLYANFYGESQNVWIWPSVYSLSVGLEKAKHKNDGTKRNTKI